MNGNKRSLFEITKRFFYPVRKKPLSYLGALSDYFLWNVTPIIHIIFLERIVYFIDIRDLSLFKKTIFIYILVMIVYDLLRRLTWKLSWARDNYITQKIVHKEYIKKFVKLDNNKTEGIGTGKLISIIESGITQWGNLLFTIMSQGISVFMTFVFTLYMIFRFNISYGVIFLFLYIWLHFVGGYFNNFMIKYRNMRVEAKHSYVKQLVKIIMSKIEILQTGKIDKEIKTLDNFQSDMINANMKMVPWTHIFFRGPDIIMFIVKIGVFFYLGTKIFDGIYPISLLVGIIGTLNLMDMALNKSIVLYKDMTKEFNVITKMWDLFDNTPSIEGYDDGKDFVYKKGDIDLKNISYQYSKGKYVFKDFSLKISGEKITAFVGPSGGGKTTLVKIIAGYIRSEGGELIIDGQRINEVSLKTYYKNIGYLTQDPMVFDGTVIDNLTYAMDREVSTDELKKVIELSKCEFIYDLPFGLDSEIGERGIRLSGGQKQRLAIAKIILKDPKIILLDEPTSALDSFSEEQITKAMHNLFKGRTVIIIAHRLQTVKNADDIIVIENGKIIERGNHKELIKQKGHYKKMLDLQSGF